MPGRNLPYRSGVPVVAEIAAGAVVLRRGKLLLLHHSREDRWCLPKGHVDPGESLEQAAAREVREETGLSDVRLEREVGEVSYRFYSPAKAVNVHKTSVYFLGRSPGGRVAPEAIFDRFAWVPFARAVQLVPYDTDRSVLELARRRVRGSARA